MNKKERREKGCVGYNYKGNNNFLEIVNALHLICIQR